MGGILHAQQFVNFVRANYKIAAARVPDTVGWAANRGTIGAMRRVALLLVCLTIGQAVAQYGLRGRVEVPALEYAPGQVVVMFREGVAPLQRAWLRQTAGALFKHPLDSTEGVSKMGSIFIPVRSDKGTSCKSENAEATRTTRIPPNPSPFPP